MSVAWTVKVCEVVLVGVPLSTPVLLSVRPVGSEPLATLQVYGLVPPLAVSVWL